MAVVDEVRIPLVRLRTEEPVEALKAAAGRPVPPRRREVHLRLRAQMPLPDHVRVPARLPEDLLDLPVLRWDHSARAWEPDRRLGDARHAVARVVAPREQARARRRAQRSRVHLGVAHPSATIRSMFGVRAAHPAGQRARGRLGAQERSFAGIEPLSDSRLRAIRGSGRVRCDARGATEAGLDDRQHARPVRGPRRPREPGPWSRSRRPRPPTAAARTPPGRWRSSSGLAPSWRTANRLDASEQEHFAYRSSRVIVSDNTRWFTFRPHQQDVPVPGHAQPPLGDLHGRHLRADPYIGVADPSPAVWPPMGLVAVVEHSATAADCDDL